MLIWKWFTQHWCNLAAKKNELECTCVNNDDFTVLVSEGGRHRGVGMCTVQPSHSKLLSTESLHIKSCLKLEHSAAEIIQMIQKAMATGSWWLEASSQQRARSCITSYAESLGKTLNHPGDSAPLQPGFGALQLLAFSKIKITFEREISDHRWDSRKYDRTADGDWENCVRSQGDFFEGDWGIIDLCTMFLVSSSINVSVFHITWLGIFWADLVYSLPLKEI